MPETVASLLNRVWAEFRRAGITDDLRIIEGVAAFLLEQENISLSKDLPRKPEAQDLEEASIKDLLRQASELAGGAAALFDRYVLFRLPEMRAGGQYPTPRHIVRLMVNLAQTDGQSVADLACGSGGFLVHSSGRTRLGVEISPEWARIARANLLLHKKRGRVREGSALKVIQKQETFKRILMNPPFGAKIRSDFGARSETALTYLALDHLKENGRAALLVPGGLLFAGSQAESNLRKRLVDEFTLEAIITLPEDALQPYSSLTAHLILILNKPPGKDTCTWFLHPVYDGYTGGRGRDLTQEPKIPNDLTLVEETIKAIREPLPGVKEIPILAKALLYQGKMLGLLIRPADAEITLASARYLPPQTGKDEKPALLLLEVQQLEVQGKDRHETWRVTLDESLNIQREESPDSLIRARLGLKKQDPLPPPDVFQSQSIHWGDAEPKRVGGILVKHADGAPQLMGVAIPLAALRARAYDLRPENYLRAPEIRPELVRPHDILLQIHERQQRLLQQMDRLAGWLVPEGPVERLVPSQVDWQEPLGALNETQQAIWENIRAQADGDRAQPFTVDDIVDDVKGNFDENEVRLALNLFEAMGLIVPITLRHPESGQPMNFYRLVEQNDRWAGPEGGEG